MLWNWGQQGAAGPVAVGAIGGAGLTMRGQAAAGAAGAADAAAGGACLTAAGGAAGGGVGQRVTKGAGGECATPSRSAASCAAAAISLSPSHEVRAAWGAHDSLVHEQAGALQPVAQRVGCAEARLDGPPAAGPHHPHLLIIKPNPRAQGSGLGAAGAAAAVVGGAAVTGGVRGGVGHKVLAPGSHHGAQAVPHAHPAPSHSPLTQAAAQVHHRGQVVVIQQLLEPVGLNPVAAMGCIGVVEHQGGRQLDGVDQLALVGLYVVVGCGGGGEHVVGSQSRG